MKKIVIIGADSYVASGLLESLTEEQVLCLSHRNWKKNLNKLEEADSIINFTIQPDFSKIELTENEIIDINIAMAIQQFHGHYIALSSRRVYGRSDECKVYFENAPLNSTDPYSHNKILMEQKLTDILADRLTILRLPNVVGEPIFKPNYQTFMGWMSRGYLTPPLIVNQNNQTIKDFVSKDFIHSCIKQLLLHPVTGIFNLSSGFGTAIQKVIDLYQINVVYSGNHLKPFDQFVLDNSRLKKILKTTYSKEDLTKSIKKYSLKEKKI